MSDGDAIIAGDGPYTLLANNPEMYLQYRADGTVWCRWPDGSFVEVVRKSDAQAEADFRARQGELLPADPQDYRSLWERDQLAKQHLFEQREKFRRERDQRDAALEEIERRLESYAEFSPAFELRRIAHEARLK